MTTIQRAEFTRIKFDRTDREFSRTKKLNESAVQEIRAAKNDWQTKKKLAKKFGVTVTTIHRVATGASWK